MKADLEIGLALGREIELSVSPPVFSKSTPPQNRQLIVYYSCLKQQVDDFVVELTSHNHLINTSCGMKVDLEIVPRDMKQRV